MRDYASPRNMAEADDIAAVIAVVAAIVSFVLMGDEKPKKKKRKHRFWQRKWLQARNDPEQANTVYKLQREILQLGDVDEFRLILRMPPDVYAWLLRRVRPYITKRNTNYRQAISAEERLALTIRHLALGDSCRSLSGQFRVGFSTTGKIIKETCVALFKCLKRDYLVTPKTEGEWLEISSGFEKTWNMPHVLGAIDGKHFRMSRPPGSGSYYFNYKHYYSLILLAVVDANYRFIYMDVGSEGKASDGGVFARSSLRDHMMDETNPLNIPAPKVVNGMSSPLPYYLVGDDAFPLRHNIMKPYPHLGQSVRERVFNYRLSRCRRTVENAFGIMSTKFRIFRHEMTMRPKACKKIIAAAIVLHNMLRERCGRNYVPPYDIDHEDEMHDVVAGQWRQEDRLDPIQRFQPRNTPQYAKQMRDRLAEHFVSPDGEVSWQYSKI